MTPPVRLIEPETIRQWCPVCQQVTETWQDRASNVKGQRCTRHEPEHLPEVWNPECWDY